MTSPRPADPVRPGKSHRVIVAALIALASERRYSAIRVADLIARAGVGRSTFYEHFAGKDAVLLEAMHPVLLPLATAASGRAARAPVRDMVRHVWERRALMRPILEAGTAALLRRRLAEMIRPHAARQGLDGEMATIAARGIAAAQLEMLHCWLAGQASATVDAMTDRLIACVLLSEERRR